MAFYTNVFMRGDYIYLRAFDKGIRIKERIPYKPYIFVPKPNGKFRTLEGKSVDKLSFDGIRDAREFVKQYENVSNFEYYGLIGANFKYLYIFDHFKGDIDYDPQLVNIGILDIECAADEGFPDITKANKPLTAITIRCRGRNYVFGCGNFHTNDPNTFYVKCKDEHDLIMKFLDTWEHLDLDVVTGWNIEFFDIPYLVNRIINLFSEKEAKRLSPYKILDEKTVDFKGKENQSYSPAGVAILDYYQLYRKFTFGNQESYKLDYISQVELGEKKIDYSEYGNLLELYKNDHQKFIEYNIHDCVLVDRLDDKMKFIEQVMAIAYDAKVNYEDTMTTVKPWDIIIHNYLLERGIVVPQYTASKEEFELVGGFVKEVNPILKKWIVSFDLNSLYPHLIMQYNISPETFCDKMDGMPSIGRLLRGEFDGGDINYSYAANGCYYRRDFQGFLPALMEKMYNSRAEYKKMMLEAKKRYEETKSSDDAKLIARYHNMQLAKKIQLNSAYGALGNRYFRWFNFNNAEAITMSGQLSIRWIENKMNEYMNKICKTDGVDYVVAADTDSIYVTFEKLIPDDSNELEAVKLIDNFCERYIQPYMDSCYEELAGYMNAYQQKMKMKRETIANKGIWKAKKMYILNAWNIEGVQYDKPKLKIQGIEAVRSSTPHVCREKIKEALAIIMNGNENELVKFNEKFKIEFMQLPFEDVAFPRGVKGLNKYKDKFTIYKSATPIQVKAVLLFNHFLEKHKINYISPIQDGDKIKFVYLKKPNPINESVIASIDGLPKEFGLDAYIDKEMQFTKAYLDPLKSIAEIINWQVEKISTIEDFFA